MIRLKNCLNYFPWFEYAYCSVHDSKTRRTASLFLSPYSSTFYSLFCFFSFSTFRCFHRSLERHTLFFCSVLHYQTSRTTSHLHSSFENSTHLSSNGTLPSTLLGSLPNDAAAPTKYADRFNYILAKPLWLGFIQIDEEALGTAIQKIQPISTGQTRFQRDRLVLDWYVISVV